MKFWESVKSLRSFIWALILLVFFVAGLIFGFISGFKAIVFYLLISFVILLVNASISLNSESDQVIWFLRDK